MPSFTRGWTRQRTKTGIVDRPVLDLLFRERSGYNLFAFIVDSGADISLAPRDLGDRLGVDWAKGKKARLSGISPRPECSVEGRIHTVKTTVPALALELKLPVCFAEGNAPYLVGRETFFDQLRVSFDKPNRKTTFTLTR